ncbi:hypothetical protein MRB53_002557 [Persea americana]|uniref:Uncharacterized protein n=1 Tax=Persea americana TaxID=3435 RepID=A0ACC2MV13_PERAE|nr:hypothetical protein MRB53_002557 [Persea americana]
MDEGFGEEEQSRPNKMMDEWFKIICKKDIDSLFPIKFGGLVYSRGQTPLLYCLWSGDIPWSSVLTISYSDLSYQLLHEPGMGWTLKLAT